LNYNDSSAVFIVYYSYICGTKTDVTVKIIQLIFILLTIVSNENVYFDNQDFQSSLDRNISNITNPFLEIHSPPPEIR